MKKIIVLLSVFVILLATGCEKKEINENLLSLAQEKLYTLNGEDGFFNLPDKYEKLSEEELKNEMKKSLDEIIERKKSGEEIVWEVKAITGIAEFFPETFEKMKEEGLLEEGSVKISELYNKCSFI